MASEGISVISVMTVMTVMAVMAVMKVPLHLDTDGDLERCVGLLHRATPRGPIILSPGYEAEGESEHDFI